MVQVRRRENENSNSLLRRFSRRIQESGILLSARKNRFYRKPKTKREKREGALKREETKKKIEKLKKLGIEDEFLKK